MAKRRSKAEVRSATYSGNYTVVELFTYIVQLCPRLNKPSISRGRIRKITADRNLPGNGFKGGEMSVILRIGKTLPFCPEPCRGLTAKRGRL